MKVPRATMRLQFNQRFTFRSATDLVPYFAALGVSHLYASPVMTARPTSMHGYDVIDPTRLNPELGGEKDFRGLVHALRAYEMGLIVDIVPNHMAVGSDNKWWMDVLTHGRHSHYAKYFDIDWDGSDLHRRGKVLLPVLGRPYGEALAAGEIGVQRTSGSPPVVHYFDKYFPLSPETAAAVEKEPASFDVVSEQGRARLHQVLEQQNYRLAWWRSANDEINWRRFFDINELAALRIEDDEVFDAIHGRILEFYAEGLIDGLRIDHVDGLAQPGDYCRKLRARLASLERMRPDDCPAGPAYLIVEKILAYDEHLPQPWELDGTTGYDFMDEVSLLQHMEAGEVPLTALWQRISGRAGRFADEEELARRQILERSFSAQCETLVDVLYDIAQADLTTRDFSRAAINRCVVELLAHFPVYRIYAKVGEASPADVHFLRRALRGAETTCLPGDRLILEAIANWLLGENGSQQRKERQSIALIRFQQLSGPLSAKAVEDTAFYRYGRLISRNDVGFDAGRFACSADQFHNRMQRRRREFPASMLATATHDHKRGEDVRARLAVLSERSTEWERIVIRWLELARPFLERSPPDQMPSDGDLAILFQTIVGAWPMTLAIDDQAHLATYAKRIGAWQQKALREGKLRSDWTTPDEEYEQAAIRVIDQLFAAPSDLLCEIANFAQKLMAPGVVNSLSQLLIKLTAPGVPDIYQGTEFWDLSLVDPDNRAPVEFVARTEMFESSSFDALISNWRDGRIKQDILRRVLAVRQKWASLFVEGDYMPCAVEGALSQHVVAFARVSQEVRALTICPRLTSRLFRNAQITIPAREWLDTRLIVPKSLRGAYENEFTGEEIGIDGEVAVARLLSCAPFGLLLGFL
jgi:(1->4)-alpha-D-glucan 1-alpha-D-glucosylmutase